MTACRHERSSTSLDPVPARHLAGLARIFSDRRYRVEPSMWNWSKLVVLAVAAPWLWYRHGRSWLAPNKIASEAVPAEDVDAVVAESGRTVEAIRSLREMHPGLGLLDAKKACSTRKLTPRGVDMSGTRDVRDSDGLFEAANLLVDFNREYDDPAPEPQWLAAHLNRLVTSGDTSVLTFGTPAIGVAVLRFRIGTMSADPEAYLAEFYIQPALRGKGYGTTFLDDVIEHARGRRHLHGPQHLGRRRGSAPCLREARLRLPRRTRRGTEGSLLRTRSSNRAR